MKQLQLLSTDELGRRLERVRQSMQSQHVDVTVVSNFANIFYLTGRVFSGFVAVGLEGGPRYFVRRPIGLTGEGVVEIRKPENIAEHHIVAPGQTLGLELDTTSFAQIERLKAVFEGAATANASPIMRAARAVKTDLEVDAIRASGVKQTYVYGRIPKLFRDGMSDIELQIAIENLSRLQGCLGQFRISGDTMEIYMGNVLAGENADTPTPYDFAMGGAGANPSLPVGADGTIITDGMTVMVDVNGDYTGYMTDMTRVFALGNISDLALKAHECSRKICREFERMCRPGVAARDLYDMAERIAAEDGLTDYFMGHHQKAGFVGHGVGIEINELPVLAPRSRDIIERGNVIALEPKFVIPKVGAVGVENTYVVGDDSVECLTTAPEQIITFD